MSDIKLFRLGGQYATEIEGRSVGLEKSLQTLIESNAEALFGVRVLASEYPTGKTHGGRIDTLGLDENYSPVIIEYKRSFNENVINQGLYYLDWLLDHRGEYELLVWKHLGPGADEIEWSTPRLICIAGDFTKYDEHAVQQINRNIELIRYRRFGEDLLLFELVNATTAQVQDSVEPGDAGGKTKGSYRTISEIMTQADGSLVDRFEALKHFILALGDDVQMKTLKYYYAFKRLRNFASVEIHPQARKITVYVKIDPSTVSLEEGFTRDVRKIGHYGTGDLEIAVASDDDLERAKPLLVRSYERS